MKKQKDWFALFENSRLIGFHEEKRVVKHYMRSIQNRSEGFLQIKQVNQKKIEKILDYQDFYLIRFGKTYIQFGYEEYVLDDYAVILAELYLAKDVLLKLQLKEKLSKSTKNGLQKTLLLLEEEIEAEEMMVPTLIELKQIKDHMDEFRYHIAEEHDDYRWNH